MSASAQKAEAQLLRAIAELTAVRVAEQVGISPSRFSDLKSDGLVERTAKLVAACGFRLVPVNEPTFDPAHVLAMESLARFYMQARVGL